MSVTKVGNPMDTRANLGMQELVEQLASFGFDALLTVGGNE